MCVAIIGKLRFSPSSGATRHLPPERGKGKLESKIVISIPHSGKNQRISEANAVRFTLPPGTGEGSAQRRMRANFMRLFYLPTKTLRILPKRYVYSNRWQVACSGTLPSVPRPFQGRGNEIRKVRTERRTERTAVSLRRPVSRLLR